MIGNLNKVESYGTEPQAPAITASGQAAHSPRQQRSSAGAAVPAAQLDAGVAPAQPQSPAALMLDSEACEKDPPVRVNFFRAMVADGWSRHERGDALTYKDAGGREFLTFEKGGVRMAYMSNALLFEAERGAVNYGFEEGCAVVAALIVEPDRRRRGLATAAMAEVLDKADAAGLCLYLEPCGLERGGISNDQLTSFYGSFGFVSASGSSKILERAPVCEQERLLASLGPEADKVQRERAR